MQKMHAQTRRQREVLDFITRYIDSHGYRPSYQVIARHMGLSSRAGIGRIVRDLEHQGFLERRRVDGHFELAITEQNGKGLFGSQVHWLETADADVVTEPIVLPGIMLGGQDPGGIRIFRVADDLMRHESICCGDIVLIELRSFARDGDIVAVRTGEMGTLIRQFRRIGAEVELGGSGDCCEVLRLAAEKVEILGVYRGLIRPISGPDLA